MTGPPGRSPVTVGFVLHVMQVAGAEVLVAEIIRRLRDRIRPFVYCLDAVGPLGERLIGEGVPVEGLGRRPGLDLGLVRRLRRALLRDRPAVLHAHQYTPFFYTALAVPFTGRPRVLFTEHGRHYPDVVSPRRRTVNRLLLSRRADHLTAVCGFSANSLAKVDGFTRRPVEIVPNGIDVARYAPAADRRAAREGVGLHPDRRHVLTIARFHPVKDHATLIAAFARVARDVPDVDLVLAGDGQERASIEASAASLGLSDRIRLLGVRQDVPDLLRAADLFALTSLSEAASLTLLEAMASGLPVVVTAVGGNPEIVRAEVDGLLVPRGDAEAAAGAMIRLLRDPALASAMGRSAAARVRAEFDLEKTVARYGELYETLATGAPGA